MSVLLKDVASMYKGFAHVAFASSFACLLAVDSGAQVLEGPENPVTNKATVQRILSDRRIVSEGTLNLLRDNLGPAKDTVDSYVVIGAGQTKSLQFTKGDAGHVAEVLIVGSDASGATLDLANMRKEFGEPSATQNKEYTQSIRVQTVGAAFPSERSYPVKYSYQVAWYGPVGLGQETKIDPGLFLPFEAMVQVRTTPHSAINMVIFKSGVFRHAGWLSPHKQ